MTKKLEFSIRIYASRPHVWHAMLDDPTYREWTRPFCEGSHYEGAWQVGHKMRFLSPDGGGMVSEIAALVPNEFVSIRHLGWIDGGVEDTKSDRVKAWAPAYENYRLADVAGTTEVRVEQDATPEFEGWLRQSWPRALAALKDLCEVGSDAPA